MHAPQLARTHARTPHSPPPPHSMGASSSAYYVLRTPLTLPPLEQVPTRPHSCSTSPLTTPRPMAALSSTILSTTTEGTAVVQRTSN